jgi:MFS family permease
MVSTLVASFLLAFFGRKTLLWTISFAMAVDLIGLGICYMAKSTTLEIILVLLYVALFEFSLGPIVWIYMAEIMTDKGVSIGTLVNWCMTIVMAIATPYLVDGIGGWLFIIFGIICCVVSFAYIYH